MTAALFASSVGAGAEQLKLGVDSEVLWTDNVFGTIENTVDDTSGRVAPWADVSNDDGRFTWGLRYKPAYEYYLDQTDLRGWDHDVDGHLQYQFTRATKLRISERFARRITNGGVREWADDLVDTEHQDLDAEPVQRLAELETDDAGPEHGNPLGQVLPVENIVVDEQTVAERREGRRIIRR